MRFLTAGLVSAGVLLSQVSAAGAPASSLQQIGAVQAAVDFCTKVDSHDRKQIERAAVTLFPDMTPARLAAARHSPEFQQAYQTIDSVLKGVAPAEGGRLCAAAAQDQRGERHEPKPEHRR